MSYFPPRAWPNPAWRSSSPPWWWATSWCSTSSSRSSSTASTARSSSQGRRWDLDKCTFRQAGLVDSSANGVWSIITTTRYYCYYSTLHIPCFLPRGRKLLKAGDDRCCPDGKLWSGREGPEIEERSIVGSCGKDSLVVEETHKAWQSRGPQMLLDDWTLD